MRIISKFVAQAHANLLRTQKDNNLHFGSFEIFFINIFLLLLIFFKFCYYYCFFFCFFWLLRSLELEKI